MKTRSAVVALVAIWMLGIAGLGAGGAVASATSATLIVRPTIIASGDQVEISAAGFPRGAKGSLIWTTSGQKLGSFTSDRQGSFSGMVTIPADAAGGTHRIVAKAEGVRATAEVIVTATESAAPSTGAVVQAITTLTLAPTADAYISQNSATTNYGNGQSLRVTGSSTAEQRTFLKFSVTGVAGTVTSATLRLYARTGSSDAPGVRMAGSGWTESGLTWNNQPAFTSLMVDNKGAVSTGTWVSYAVTGMVTANGTYTFALQADAATFTEFQSRNSKSTHAQLVLTVDSSGSSGNTPTAVPMTATPAPTATATRTATATLTPTSTQTSTPVPTATNTPQPTATNTPLPTSTTTPQPTSTSTPAPTSTNTPVPTATNTPVPTSTSTPVPTATNTPEPTATNTPRPTATSTVVPTATSTPIPTETGTATATVTSTPTATATAVPADVTVLTAGDISSCSTSGDEATASILDAQPGTVLAVGDLAYQSGSASEFTNCYDPTWGRHKARTYPVPGNHEYGTANAAGYYGYWGSTAGDPTKGYYSFDLGAWHIIALNSNCGSIGGCGAGSAQEVWLRADLAAHPGVCTLAMWHHPLYSSGTHGNQTAMQPMFKALYDYHADIVLGGHDHHYERFGLQDASGNADANGVRQWVVGMGGIGHYAYGTIRANTEVRNNDTFGVLKLTLKANSYEWQFLPEAGKTFSDTGSTSCHNAPASGSVPSADNAGSLNHSDAAAIGSPFNSTRNVFLIATAVAVLVAAGISRRVRRARC